MGSKVQVNQALSGLDESRIPYLRIDPQRLQSLIERHGVSGELRRSMICPCVRSETGRARLDCPSCLGLGRLYPAHAREPLCVLLLNRNPMGSDAEPGAMVRVDATMTLPLPIVPGRGDMFVPDREQHVVDEVFHAGRLDADAEVLAEEELTGISLESQGSQSRSFTLRYPADVTGCPLVVEHVSWWDGQQARMGTEGEDWWLDGRELVFAPGAGPSQGEAHVSVRYRAPAAYVVEHNPAFYRAGSGVTVPFRCGVSRLDKMGKRDLL